MGLFCSSPCPGATGRRSALEGVVFTAAVAASVINRCRCQRRGRSIDRSIDLVMLLDRMVSLLGRSISLLCRSACGSISRRRRRSPTRSSTHSRRSTRTTTTRRTAARAAATTPRPRSCLRRALTMGCRTPRHSLGSHPDFVQQLRAVSRATSTTRHRHADLVLFFFLIIFPNFALLHHSAAYPPPVPGARGRRRS